MLFIQFLKVTQEVMVQGKEGDPNISYYPFQKFVLNWGGNFIHVEP